MAVQMGDGPERRGRTEVGGIGAALDPGTIIHLRDDIPREARLQLIGVFEQQHARCLAEIDAAVDRGERDEARRVAHLLKGSAATLGAVRLGICCAQLERVGLESDESVCQMQIGQARLAAAEATEALRLALA